MFSDYYDIRGPIPHGTYVSVDGESLYSVDETIYDFDVPEWLYMHLFNWPGEVFTEMAGMWRREVLDFPELGYVEQQAVDKLKGVSPRGDCLQHGEIEHYYVHPGSYGWDWWVRPIIPEVAEELANDGACVAQAYVYGGMSGYTVAESLIHTLNDRGSAGVEESFLPEKETDLKEFLSSVAKDGSHLYYDEHSYQVLAYTRQQQIEKYDKWTGPDWLYKVRDQKDWDAAYVEELCQKIMELRRIYNDSKN